MRTLHPRTLRPSACAGAVERDYGATPERRLDSEGVGVDEGVTARCCDGRARSGSSPTTTSTSCWQEVTLLEAASGETLFEEGDPSTGVAAVLEGQVDVRRGGRTLVTLGPGTVLGELSLFLPSATRTATAVASSPVRMVVWPATDLPARLAAHERLATAVVADLSHVLAGRLRASDAGRRRAPRRRRPAPPAVGPRPAAASRRRVAVRQAAARTRTARRHLAVPAGRPAGLGDYFTSKRSSIMTLSQASTKSFTNFSFDSSNE